MNHPTDLSPAEEQIALARLRELAEKFTADGSLRTSAWREVFQRTWRHPYVPTYYPALDGPCVLCIDPNQRADWLDAVYSDQTLITKVVQVPMQPSLRPGAYPMYTSSSTLPSLVLTMLEELDVTDGCRVLEIGTGSGYDAALLCERLGSQYVTSVDIDPELVELAGERLAANGHTPTLAAVDGEAGYPAGAPYDRIIATCSVPAIPAAWLEQAAPGALILADVHGPLGGTLARLTVNADGVATGRFVSHWAGFMSMRHTVDLPSAQHTRYEDEPAESLTVVDPTQLQSHGLFGFVAQWHLPDASWGLIADDDGQPSIHLFAPDGSTAIVRNSRTVGGHKVTQYGPRRLWDRVEQAHQFWHDAGRPNYDRFGITATTTEQHVWYDRPDGPHRWSLPLRTTR